jgi:hypothetical protein
MTQSEGLGASRLFWPILGGQAISGLFGGEAAEQP